MAVKDASGNLLVSYSYDALGRRISETPTGGSTRDFYFSAAWQVLEERVGGTARVQYVWSPVYVDALVLRDRDADSNGSLEERLWVQQDANWNVTALVDGSGAVVERYGYDPYGTVTVLTPSWGSRSSSSYGWLYLHQGGRLDTTSGLYEFRFRWYSPSLARWLQPDPLGFGGGGIDFYLVVGDRPVSAVDPSGLQAPAPPPTPVSPPSFGPGGPWITGLGAAGAGEAAAAGAGAGAVVTIAVPVVAIGAAAVITAAWADPDWVIDITGTDFWLPPAPPPGKTVMPPLEFLLTATSLAAGIAVEATATGQPMEEVLGKAIRVIGPGPKDNEQKPKCKFDDGHPPGPYAHLEGTDRVLIEPGRKFTPEQRDRILGENRTIHGGKLKSDDPKDPVQWLDEPLEFDGPLRNTPKPTVTIGGQQFKSEAQVDHIRPREVGGSNSYCNAQVISQTLNILKRDGKAP